MNKHESFRIILVLGFLFLLARVLSAQTQTAPANKVLVVNGKTAGGTVREIDGHSYVDIAAVAQLVNGVVTVEPTRIVLTIPVSEPTPAPAAAPSAAVAQTVPGLSRDFAASAIAEVAEMREWRGVIGTMVNYGLAVSDAWAQDYRARVNSGLAQVALAASTDSDRDALQLLRNEFDTLSGWANDVLAARQALNGSRTIDPNSLQNDPVLAKITSCSRFLDGMLVSGVFSDDGSCH